MVFSDAVFLYAFFPIVFIIYYICRKIQLKNAVLLVASLVFYSWGEPKYVVLMIGVSLIAYIGGFFVRRSDIRLEQIVPPEIIIVTIPAYDNGT